MMLDSALAGPPSPHACIGVGIDATVGPSASPARVIDEHGIPSPSKAAKARPPAPRPEKYTQRNAKPEANRPAHKEARPRREEHDSRIVIWDHNVVWIYRHDRDVRSGADN